MQAFSRVLSMGKPKEGEALGGDQPEPAGGCWWRAAAPVKSSRVGWWAVGPVQAATWVVVGLSGQLRAVCRAAAAPPAHPCCACAGPDAVQIVQLDAPEKEAVAAVLTYLIANFANLFG